jgi:hypothetical protein
MRRDLFSYIYIYIQVWIKETLSIDISENIHDQSIVHKKSRTPYRSFQEVLFGGSI